MTGGLGDVGEIVKSGMAWDVGVGRCGVSVSGVEGLRLYSNVGKAVHAWCRMTFDASQDCFKCIIIYDSIHRGSSSRTLVSYEQKRGGCIKHHVSHSHVADR